MLRREFYLTARFQNHQVHISTVVDTKLTIRGPQICVHDDTDRWTTKLHFEGSVISSSWCAGPKPDSRGRVCGPEVKHGQRPCLSPQRAAPNRQFQNFKSLKLEFLAPNEREFPFTWRQTLRSAKALQLCFTERPWGRPPDSPSTLWSGEGSLPCPCKVGNRLHTCWSLLADCGTNRDIKTVNLSPQFNLDCLPLVHTFFFVCMDPRPNLVTFWNLTHERMKIIFVFEQCFRSLDWPGGLCWSLFKHHNYHIGYRIRPFAGNLLLLTFSHVTS